MALIIMRPWQWTKNLFVFLPIFFGGKLFDVTYLVYVISTFFAFCFMSSAVYCFNDIMDIELDRNHPIKKNRPIASGKIKIGQAVWLMVSMIVASVVIILMSIPNNSFSIIIILIIYLLINILYSLKLKHYAIIDVFIIGFGFVLRILGGGVSGNVTLSHWIILMVFLISLFLGFAKRRDDFMLDVDSMKVIRKSITGYNPYFLNMLLVITGTITIVSYILYTVSPEVIQRYSTSYVYISTIFVIAGIFRYLQLSVVYENSGSPTDILLKDKVIRGCIFCWLLFFVFIIYLK